jgi:hypothetical protein
MDVPISRVPLGYQQITSLSTAKTLTVPATANFAMITVSGQSVRYRDDGTAPDATHGVVLPVGNPALQYSGNLSALQFIETTASATLDVLYYKAPNA